jgi:ketosteroid isomerase-like protein
MACFAPHVLTFDLAPPLQHAGRQVIRRGLEEWFPIWDGPIGLEICDLRVTVDSHIAYCTSLTFPLCVHGQDSCGLQAKYP